MMDTREEQAFGTASELPAQARHFDDVPSLHATVREHFLGPARQEPTRG